MQESISKLINAKTNQKMGNDTFPFIVLAIMDEWCEGSS